MAARAHANNSHAHEEEDRPPAHPICSFAGFFVVEQTNEALFNRAWLLNVGADLAHKMHGANVFAFHDVDMLPTDPVSYVSVPRFPLQLSAEIDRFGFEPPYAKYAGGVTLLTREQLAKIDGLSNTYFGWGSE